MLKGNDNRSARVWLSPAGGEGAPGQALAEAQREPLILYALDTTAQRQLEQQVAQTQKMDTVGQLAGGIAHDFNNVLQAIIGYSDLLLASHKPTDPAFQDIMQIKQNANRAAGLVRQLLAFSRRQTLRPRGDERRRGALGTDPASEAPARRARRTRPQARARHLAGEGRREPVRAGDREPRGQCARRHARPAAAC